MSDGGLLGVSGMSLDRVSGWAGTPPPTKRKEGVLYREKDVKEILGAIDTPGRKVVLVEGVGGAGKSTTIIELAYLLEQQKRNFTIFSPKEFFLHRNEPSYRYGLKATISQLEKHASTDKKEMIVLMDSGDYLFTRDVPWDKSFDDLKAKEKEVGSALRESDKNLLEYYKDCERLIDVLGKPCYKVITTWHSDWSSSNRDQTLFGKWRRLFTPGSEHVLSEKVPYDKGAAYLGDRPDLGFGDEDRRFLEKLALVMTFAELQRLTPDDAGKLREIRNNVDEHDWLSGVARWAVKRFRV